MDNVWTFRVLGMDMRQLALYIVTILVVLLIALVVVKRR